MEGSVEQNRGEAGHVKSQPLTGVSQEQQSRVTTLASTGFRGGELTVPAVLL